MKFSLMSRNSDQNYGALWLLTPTVLLYLATFLFPLILLGVLSFAKFEASITTLGFYFDNYIKIFSDGITLKIFFQTVRLSIYITKL